MFCGYDAKAKWGMIDYDPSLIERWERPKELHRVWILSIMSGIKSGQIPWEDISQYRKPYTEGKDFRRFIAINSGHESSVRAELAKEAAKKNAERKKEALIAKRKEQSRSSDTAGPSSNSRAVDQERKLMAEYRERSSDARGML